VKEVGRKLLHIKSLHGFIRQKPGIFGLVFDIEGFQKEYTIIRENVSYVKLHRDD